MTQDGRHFYRKALPWEPVFQLIDSCSAISVTLKEQIGVDREITFSRLGYHCYLTLWRYPIDTAVSKSTTKEQLPMPSGVEAIVTRISYVFHSDSIRRHARIDSLGRTTISVPHATYLAILSVSGYQAEVIKDLEVRPYNHSIVQATLRKWMHITY